MDTQEILDLFEITLYDYKMALAVAKHVAYNDIPLTNDVVCDYGFTNVDDFNEIYIRAHACNIITFALPTRSISDICDFYIFKAKKHFPYLTVPNIPNVPSVPNIPSVSNDSGQSPQTNQVAYILYTFLSKFTSMQLMSVSW